MPYLTGMPGLLAPQSPAASMAHPAALATTGRIVYVSSTRAGRGDDNVGDDPNRPKATTQAAIRACRANRGDIIVGMPGHAETLRVADAINFSVAGVSFFGLGNGADRPTYTFETSTAACISFSAASCRMFNVVGIPGIADLTNPFNVTANDCALNIEWQDASATLDARRAILATAVSRLNIALTYQGYTTTRNVLNAVQLNGCRHVDIDIDAYGYAWSAWIEFVTSPCYNVKVSGTLFTSDVTDGTHNVVDTVGDSEWSADFMDVSAGGRFLGGSGRSLYEPWSGTQSILTVLRALGVIDLSEDIAELTDKFDALDEHLQDTLGA